MTIARTHLVDPAVTRWCHCVTRCVRRAFLLGEGPDDRKLGIENRLEQLAPIFGLSVTGFAVPDNHLHILVRLDPGTKLVSRNWCQLIFLGMLYSLATHSFHGTTAASYR